jgi:transporter family protein
MVGAERIFLKQLEEYDVLIISAIFFLGASLFLSPIFLFIPQENLLTGLGDLKFAFLSSIIYTFGFFSYVKAISTEDTSLIAPLYYSSLIWLLLLGSLILDEDVTILRALGGVTMFGGVFFLYSGSISERVQKIRSSSASLLMIGGSLFLAIGRTVDTYAIRSIDERIYAFAINLFSGLIFLVLSIIMNRYSDGIIAIQTKPKAVIMAAVTNGWAYLMLLIAISGLEVTVAEPASLLSIFVTAFMAKKVLGEEINERIPGMVLMIVGAIMLFI